MQRNQIDKVIDPYLEGWRIEIETNGTVMPTEKQLTHAQFNCSPKVPSSGNSVGKSVKPKVLTALNKAHSCFKFVCSKEEDLDEIEALYMSYLTREKVYIMPEGVVESEITPHARVLADATIRHGFNMTPRLQAIAFDGAKRGV